MTFIAAIAASVATAPSQIELTVYNQGFGLVKEQRELNLTKGEQEILVEDVAQRIEANSVAIKSLTAPGSFTVLEQNYKYDLISPNAILNKAVGKEITFNRTLPDGSKESIIGTLMSSPTAVVSQGSGRSTSTYNGMVIQTRDGRIILNPTGEIQVNSIPEGLISKPTLLWLLDSAKSGKNKIQLSYVTQGISWTSDYVLTLGQEGKIGALKGWVTMNNNSGISFKDAKLKLLAGDVNRVQTFRGGGFGGQGGGFGAPVADAAVSTEQFSEYHLYTVNRPTTVGNNEQKQISLLEGFDIPVKKRLVVDAMRSYGRRQPGEGDIGTGDIKPLVQLQFVNDEESGLGMALPAGRVKVFQPDSTGSLQMVGEDRIDHTPKKETIKLNVGRAFDIRASRKRTHFEWIMSGSRRRGAIETFEIEVRNRKDTAEVVEVMERHWGEYTISKNSMEFTKPDSDTVLFMVQLKPEEVKTVTYTIRTTW
jgi:hypothetical protein